MGSLKIFDTVKFSLLDSNLIKVKDDYAGAFKPEVAGQLHPSGMGLMPGQGQGLTPSTNATQQTGLLVRIAATHSGLITRNNGFYLPDKMKKGASSFTDNYPKPVLLHHNDHHDNIGRIIQATYRDTSGAIADKYNGFVVKDRRGNEKGVLDSKLLKDFSSGNMPFGMMVDVVTALLRDSILDDTSYDGLGYIELVANITDPEAIQKLLDGRYLTGSVGATTNAAICSVCKSDWTDSGQCEHRPGGIYDGAKCFIIAGDLTYDEYSFVNVPADRHSKVLELHYNGIQDSVKVEKQFSGAMHEVKLGFPQYELPIKEESSMKVEDAKKKEEGVKVQDSTVQSGEPSTVKTEEATVTTEAPAADAPVVDSKTEETKVDETVTTTETKTEDAKTEDAKVEDGLDPVEALVTKALSDVELTDEEDETLYQALWAEVESALTEKVLTDELVKDKKLSAEKRKGLAKSTFCGPGRSFPVPDCAHVTAARRLIGRYKGPGDKATILACVASKAKSLGCDSSKDATDTTQEADQSALLDKVAGLEKTIEELKGRLEAQRKEYTALSKDFDALQDSVVKAKLDTRKVKESHLKTLKALRDHKIEAQDLSTLEEATLDLEIEQTLKVVDMVKITDKLGDGMSRIPTGEVHSPVDVTKTAEEPKKSFDVDSLSRIHEQYLALRLSRGQSAAEAFLVDMRKKGKLPQE